MVAYAKGRTTIACGPGRDTVKIGFNRLVRPARDCEKVTKRYSGKLTYASAAYSHSQARVSASDT